MRISFIILLLAALGLGSCNKFLEEKSPSDLTPQSTEDYSQLLLGTGYLQEGMVVMQYLPLMTDDLQMYVTLPDVDTDIANRAAFPAFTWQYNYLDYLSPLPKNAPTPWKNFYKLIIGCNIALDAVGESVGTMEEKQQLQGEAMGLRAFYYWHLVNMYGYPYNDSASSPEKELGVPLILASDLRDKPAPRNTVAEVYEQIRKDIEASVLNLSYNKKSGSANRFNYRAARLMASRIYLHTEEWEKVIEHASALIDQQPAIPNLNDWPAGYFYDESTWKPIYSKENAETVFLYGNRNEYNMANQYIGISEELGALFQPTDLRTTIYFSEVPEALRWLISVKYFEQKRNPFPNDTKERASSLRITEAYLNRAEANTQLYIKTGNATYAQNALDDLNYIRSRRYRPADFQPVTLLPGNELLQFCRDERRRELFEEGQRWFDLRRYGMPAISHSFILQAQTQRYLLKKRDPLYKLQIPSEAILLNGALEQNPGGEPRNPQ